MCLFINENFTKNQINKIIDKILLLEKKYKIKKNLDFDTFNIFIKFFRLQTPYIPLRF